MARSTQLAIALSILAVAARLIWIDQPYIDTWSWRQSDVAAIARNYFQHGFRFANPQIDWAGNTPGYVGTEFPILPFLAAVCYQFLGIHEWIGRLETVALFALSLPFFYLLVHDTWHGLPAHELPSEVRPSAGCRCHVAAIWALLFYSFAPLNLFAGREFMPDVPSLSLGLAGLYFFKRWTDNENRSCLFASTCAIALSILIKAPSAIIAAPLACLCFQRFRFSGFQRFTLWLFAAIAFTPAAVWYWHAYSIARDFYPHHFFGGGGIRIEDFGAYEQIGLFTATASLTPVLVILAAAGLFVTRKTNRARVFRWWLGVMLMFIIIVGKGNRHPWYQLPLVPIGAAFAGAACAFAAGKIRDRRTKAVLTVLLAAAFCGSSFYYARPFYRAWATHLRDTGLELRRITPPTSLIIAADHGDPTILYYAERRGWHLPEKDGIYNGEPGSAEQLINDVAQLRNAGATHVVFVASTFWFLDQYRDFARYLAGTAIVRERTSEFTIYEFKPNE